MAIARTPRSTRVARHVQLRPRERDFAILEALGKMRFLTTTQLSRLFFGGSRWCANKRLRRLYDAGLVRVWVRSLSQENLYSLSRQGSAALQRHPDQDVKFYAPNGVDKQLEHLRTINDLRIGFAIDLGRASAELESWRSDWELRANRRTRLVPDAIFTIRWLSADTRRAYSLEVDHHTKSAERFVRKIMAYGAARYQPSGLFGFADYILLAVVCDDAWLARYREQLANLRLKLPLYFARGADVDSVGPVGAVWMGIYGSTEKASLRDISNLPYRKEGLDSEEHGSVSGNSAAFASYNE